jgi:phage tail sheath protein FI
MASPPQTPGVYINEINAFPNSVVPVATAVPVFIGYTMRADYKGKSYLNQAVQIESLQDFLTFYGVVTGSPPTPVADQQQYVPIYHAVPSQGGGDMILGGNKIDLLPDPSTIYYLYNSIKLFYQNGGATAFAVSVGLITPSSSPSKPIQADSALVNPNVKLTDLQAGLAVASQEAEITMIVIPDAVLLKEEDNANLMQDMLMQCGAPDPDQCCAPLSRVALLDVYGAQAPAPKTWDQPGGEIATFRTNVGMNYLSYGISYFPFLKTTIVQDGDINFVNLGGGKALASVLPNATVEPLKTILSQMQTAPAVNPPTPLQLENALLAASDDYTQLHNHVLEKINTLPPSGAMAGVYTMVDTSIGVWKAPANLSLTAVTDTTLPITDSSQGFLNVDSVTGKSINAIRLKPGFGVMVWGARTLDGNSQDWRYINVRRTMIFIEQSLKQAMRAYVFYPNVVSTWSLVQSMVTAFLTSQWNQGALAGSTAAASFSVAIGLGLTMTADDILNGNMNLSVQVAVSHPAEFITINISQNIDQVQADMAASRT